MVERLFRLSENQTGVRTEMMAGITTFLTMAYIIFVQPAVLSGKMFGTDTGLEFGAVTTATCISAAVATAIMALYARYPIAQAPGMGENFFFVFSTLPAATAAGFAGCSSASRPRRGSFRAPWWASGCSRSFRSCRPARGTSRARPGPPPYLRPAPARPGRSSW